jgi:hypothetical protein
MYLYIKIERDGNAMRPMFSSLNLQITIKVQPWCSPTRLRDYFASCNLLLAFLPEKSEHSFQTSRVTGATEQVLYHEDKDFRHIAATATVVAV